MLFDRGVKMHSKGKVYQVKLRENTGAIILKELNLMNKLCCCSILFKMQGSVYALGHASCERYDIQGETWVDSQHVLPRGFTFKSSSVAVSQDESFAVITRVIKDGDLSGPIFIFIFTEDCGFQILDTGNRDRIKLSIQIE